jgi:hypothetical protein
MTASTSPETFRAMRWQVAQAWLKSGSKVAKDRRWPMSHDKAAVRIEVERLDGVTKAWFEWIYEKGEMSKVLAVEVNFDTDPNSLHFRRSVIDAIVNTAKAADERDTTMIVNRLRIVPPP